MRRTLTALPIAIFRQGSTSCARGIFTFWRFLVLWTRFKRTILSYFEEIMPVCFHALDTERESCESVTCVTYPKSAATFSSTHFCQSVQRFHRNRMTVPWSRASRPLSLFSFPFDRKKHVHALFSLPLFFGMTHRIGWYACQSLMECGAKAVLLIVNGQVREQCILMPQPVIWVNTHLYNNYIYFI